MKIRAFDCFTFFLFFSGAVFFIYDLLFLFSYEASFAARIFSFSHIWLLFSVMLFVPGIYRIRKKRSFFKNISRPLRVLILTALSSGTLVCAVCLCIIIVPAAKIPDGAKIFQGERCDMTQGASLSQDGNPASDTEKIPCDEKSVFQTCGARLILLGGGINLDGSLSESVRKRVEAAANCLLMNKDALAVVTGGIGKFSVMPESVVLKRELSSYGIAPERIFEENRAEDTIQNMRFSAERFCDAENVTLEEVFSEPVIIVTSASHISRALFLAEKTGFKNPVGIKAEVPLFYAPNVYLREICSWIKLFIRFVFSLPPF